MKQRADYNRAANAACRLLVESGRVEPRASVLEIAACCRGIAVASYREMAERLGLSSSRFAGMLSSAYGLTIRRGREALILYNQEKDPCTVRFTIAHELGHAVLHHLEDDAAANREANCFARNLLCPLTVARRLHLTTPQAYARVFGVSLPMATVSWQRRDADARCLDPELEERMESLLAQYFLRQSGRMAPDGDGRGLPLSLAREGEQALLRPAYRTEQAQREWEDAFRAAERRWLYGE